MILSIDLTNKPMHNKTDIDLIFESYSKTKQIAPDFDAMFNKVYDRLPESQDESDSFLFDVLDAEASNGVSKAELISKYGEDAVATYERFGEQNDLFEGPFEDAEGDDFPSLQRGQKVYVTLTDGSELQGVLDFDGVDLARSNMFTIDGGEEIGVEHISEVNLVSTEDSEESESNIYERLEEFMETVDDDTVDYLRQILTDFKDIITDINALEAPDQKIDAVGLGIHLNRLAPFSNM